MCISALSGLSLGNSEHSMTIAWFVCKRSLIQFLTNYSYLKFSLNVVDLLVDGCYIVIRFPDTHSQMKFFWDLRRKTWVIFLSGDVERKNTPKERLVFSAIPKICINKYFSFAIILLKINISCCNLLGLLIRRTKLIHFNWICSVYSGTVAGAREAFFHGVPSVSISYDWYICVFWWPHVGLIGMLFLLICIHISV